MFLCADIGGTKTRLCLNASKDSYDPLHIKTYLNARYHGFKDILADYLKKYKPRLTSACLAVAGPIHNNFCIMTNLNWKIDGTEIGQQFAIATVLLINDLSATALAVPLIDTDDFLVLQNALPKLQDGPIAVIAAGTGLGESVLQWDHNLQRHHTINSEGGHKDFSPHDAISRELNEYIIAKEACNYLSIEDLLSGRGLQRMYDFFTQKNKTLDGNKPPSPAQILDLVNAGNAAAIATVQCFIRLMATEASNVAMQYYSTGGVVIAGGLMPRLLPQLDIDDFLTRFTDKHQFHNWLKTIPVLICRNTEAPLVGAFYYLQQYLHTQHNSPYRSGSMPKK